MADIPPGRSQPGWFEAVDEIILDYIEVREPTTPAPIGDYTDLEFDYVLERARRLEDAGLLESTDENIYELTERGQAYLDGEADLGDLPEPE